MKEGNEHPHPFPPPLEGEGEGGGEQINQAPSHRKRWVPSPFPLPTGERTKVRGRKNQTLAHRKRIKGECEVKEGYGKKGL